MSFLIFIGILFVGLLDAQHNQQHSPRHLRKSHIRDQEFYHHQHHQHDGDNVVMQDGAPRIITKHDGDAKSEYHLKAFADDATREISRALILTIGNFLDVLVEWEKHRASMNMSTHDIHDMFKAMRTEFEKAKTKESV